MQNIKWLEKTVSIKNFESLNPWKNVRYFMYQMVGALNPMVLLMSVFPKTMNLCQILGG